MANSIRLFPANLLTVTILLIAMTGYSQKTHVLAGRKLKNHLFLSEYYNHFEGGVLFTDIESGLTVLWGASFKNGRPYKENLGLLVSGGLLILPNHHNTIHSSRFDAATFVENNKLYVSFNGLVLQVMGIAHTHPDGLARSEPTPGKDFQYAYLGIHNYIINKKHLYDAFYNARGNEVFDRFGISHSVSRFSHNYSIKVADLR